MHDVDICNMALALVGKPPINVMSEASAEARQCRIHYPQARRALLQSSGWTFAKRRAPLAQLTDNDFPERWHFAYARPEDALSILRVYGPFAPLHGGPRPEFEVRENRVYANHPEIKAEYIFDQTDAGRFSPLFVDALAAELAARLARPLTRSAQLSVSLGEDARRARSAAITADSAQDVQYYMYDENAPGEDYSEARR